ncbi:MAG TPA: type II secretion system protein [Lacipirellulaceae bacterium]|nr:type II secretion system protein [Lacipirellulaceae bacterium]
MTPHRTSRPSRGFTLLEVILALVVLGAALAMLSEVMQLASRHAVEARAETQAQQLAESVMDQLLCGAIALKSASREALDVDDPIPWVYSVTVGDSAITGIAPVEVLIEQDIEARLTPVAYRLVRWFPTTIETPETAAGMPGAGAAAGGSGGPAGGSNSQGPGGAGPGGGT